MRLPSQLMTAVTLGYQILGGVVVTDDNGQTSLHMQHTECGERADAMCDGHT